MASRLQIAGDLEALLSQSGIIDDERPTRSNRRSLPRALGIAAVQPALTNTITAPTPVRPPGTLAALFGIHMTPSPAASTAGPTSTSPAVNPMPLSTSRAQRVSISNDFVLDPVSSGGHNNTSPGGSMAVPPDATIGLNVGSGRSSLPSSSTQVAAGARSSNPSRSPGVIVNPLTSSIASPTPANNFANIGLNQAQPVSTPSPAAITSPPSARIPKDIRLPRAFSSAARRAAEMSGSDAASPAPLMEATTPLATHTSSIASPMTSPTLRPRPPVAIIDPSSLASLSGPMKRSSGLGSPIPRLSLLATSDMEYAPTVNRTLHLNASSPAPSLQIVPTPPKFGSSQLHSPLVPPSTQELVTALLDHANSNIAMVNSIAAPASGHGIVSPQPPGLARANTLHARQPSNLQLPATINATPSPPTSAPIQSPGTARMRGNVGSSIWKRGNLPPSVDSHLHGRAKSTMEETFAAAQSGPGRATSFDFATALELNSPGESLGFPSVDSRVQLRVAGSTSISNPERPSPSMVSRPSVAFVATNEGMSIVEAVNQAKMKEKEKQAERERARAEKTDAAQSSPSVSPVLTSSTGRSIHRPYFSDLPSLLTPASPINGPASPPIGMKKDVSFLLTPTDTKNITATPATPATTITPQSPLTRRPTYARQDSLRRRTHSVGAATSDPNDDAGPSSDDRDSAGEQLDSNPTSPNLSSSGALSKRSSSKRTSQHVPLMLLDPLTGLPIDRTKQRESVYMNMIDVPPTSPDPLDLQAATNLLNSLSSLHQTAVMTNGAPAAVNGEVGPAAMGKIMSAVKVERVELKTLFKAPTLMQQAKAITAAIILQKQARIAERRAIIQKRQAEADALEQELEAAAAATAAAARDQRARDRQLRIERQTSREMGFHVPSDDDEPANSRLGGVRRMRSIEFESKTEHEPRTARTQRTPTIGPTSSLNRLGSLDFSVFDFSGAGTAWGKDQIGSHLKVKSVDRPAPVEVAPVRPPSPPKPHSSGFGLGTTDDNNGAHHPLMNPTHPNFFSHLNPNSINYNSHINPKHDNYNPLNNPTHPHHDDKYNNPRHPLFNPFYKHPKLASKDYIQSTFHLHGGSPLHPAHPAHPMFTPHTPTHAITQAVIANSFSNLASPTHNPNMVQTPSGSVHKWTSNQAGVGANNNEYAGGAGSDTNSGLTIDTAANAGANGSVSSRAFDASPLSPTSPSILPSLTRPTSFARPGSLGYGFGPNSPRVGPISPRNNGGTVGFGFGTTSGGARTTYLTARDKRQAYVLERDSRERQIAQEFAKALHAKKAEANLASPAAKVEATPTFDPADPFANLDLSGKSGVPLAKQFARFTYQQLEFIRREAVNASIGMPTPGKKGGQHGGNDSSGSTMSKFFRETLQKALGGDIWRLAQEIAANPDSKRGAPDDPLKGISLCSLSLKAHMALFGAGALTDSDGRPVDEFGCYLDVDDQSGERATAIPIAPFPPKKFFLQDEAQLYEAELREQLKKDHESRVREYEDVVNIAKRRWNIDPAAAQLFHDEQDRLIEKTAKAIEGAAFLGRPVKNQWDQY